MNLFRKVSIAFTLTAGVALGNIGVASADPSIQDLGALQPINYSTGLNVNSSGTVVGRSRVFDTDLGDIFAHATLWAPPDYTIQDLHPAGLSPRPDFTFGYGISDTGLISGRAGTASPANQFGYIYDPSSGTATVVPRIGGDSYGNALSVNSAGHAAGNSGVLGAAVTQLKGIFFDGTNSVQIPALGSDPETTASSISEGDAVVGDSGFLTGTTTTPFHAYVWTSGSGTQQLPLLFGDSTVSEANAISHDGNYIVGREANATTNHMILWTNDGTGNYTPQEIPPPPDPDGPSGTLTGVATAADGSAVVVGEADTPEADPEAHTFVWTSSGGSVDLNTLFTLPPDHEITSGADFSHIQVDPATGQKYIATSQTINASLDLHATLITLDP